MIIYKPYYKIKDALDHNRVVKRYLTKRSAIKKMQESIYYWIDEDVLISLVQVNELKQYNCKRRNFNNV